MKRALLCILLLCGILLLLGVLLPSRTPVEAVVTYLPLGWWYFLQRNVPKLAWNWNIIGMGLLCSAVFLVLGNRLLSALYGQMQRLSQPNQLVRPWRWRWIVCLYATVWLLFAIAFGAAGVYRHTTWLMNQKEPWYVERHSGFRELKETDLIIATLLLDCDDDLQKTCNALLSQRTWHHPQNALCEDFEVILYANSSNKVQAYVVIPRNPKLPGKGEFAASLPDNHRLTKPLSELGRTLAKLDAQFPRHRE